MSIQIIKMNKFFFLVSMLTAALLLTGTLFSFSANAATQKKRPLNSVKSITYGKDKHSEKVTIAMEREVSYKSRFLDKNPKMNLPYRLYLDLLNTRLSRKIKKIYYPEKSNIIRVRIAQRNKNTTRVVLDIKRKIKREDYKISQLNNPSRLVIEISSKEYARTKKTTKKVSRRSTSHSSPDAARQQAKVSSEQKKPAYQRYTRQSPTKASDVCVIVIDPGHGGKDPGAIGYKGIKEKDVCFAIALELKKLLDAKPKCKTILTRYRDKFVSLEERAQIANSNNADLFISIHANSHEDETLFGIETYYLNFSSDASARRVAARENFTTPAEISDLELILFDLLQSDKINKSSIFAGYIHNALVENISKKYTDLRNLGVKHAPMRVLIDAEMPGVLLETAFLSNPSDARRLKSRSYQKLIAKAVLDGILDYTDGLKTAYYRNGD
jgi:N-acetylmuramoyl-L-alanine amidase